MSYQLRLLLVCTMTTALACGFMHHIVAPSVMNFERLHIFLFNLCSGGTLLLFFTEDQEKLSKKGWCFYLLAICFAITSFLEWYPPALVLPLLLAAIVEKVRIDSFGSLFPKDLFTRGVPVTQKFHQASLLCLSIGLTMSSPVILNTVYVHWFEIERLTLNTFFLGFSFPLSLISMSVIFTLMRKNEFHMTLQLKELLFWMITLGVIIFFLFILAHWFIPQVMIATTLFVAVAMIFYLYIQQGKKLQQKTFLSSGIVFLLITSITGIMYILFAFSESYNQAQSQPLLRIHAFTALYGWNLSGLVVIARRKDFPLKLHSKKTILLHWVTVLLLCPLGYFFPLFAILAVLFYAWLLYTLLLKEGKAELLAL